MFFTSKYAVFFDSSCPLWSKDRESNEKLLREIETYYNELFKARGYVFLRDIYEKLGVGVTKESIVVGWHRRSSLIEEKPIQFRLHTTGKKDPHIIVDFNVVSEITKYF